MNSRFIKILLGACVSLYMWLVCFNNISDYDSNFQFVHMVTGMDDVFSKAHTGWRGMHSGTFQQVTYIIIIAWEITVSVLSALGVFSMFRFRAGGADEFNAAKKWLNTGLALGIVLWFGVFISIAGEWFLMWQSKDWNGQTTAFFLSICFLLFLTYVSQRDA